MIRLTPKEKSKGLKKTPLKRKPFKRKPPKVPARKPLVMREKKPSRLKINSPCRYSRKAAALHCRRIYKLFGRIRRRPTMMN